MRRAMSTALIGYADLKTRLEDEGRPMVILPELQEVKFHTSNYNLSTLVRVSLLLLNTVQQ